MHNLNCSTEPDRKMASIVRIDSILPIEGADRIVIAEIEGWRCVVNKNDFKIGDLAVYYCEDSIPNFEDPNLAFLKDKGIQRIKIIKIKGIVSQGLLGPLSWLEGKVSDISQLKIGDDLTEILQVKKYVKPEEFEQYNNISNMTFPSNIPKTNEERLQNNIKMIKNIMGRNIVITRKEDGCSCTFSYFNGIFNVCGRNYILENGDPSTTHYFLVEKMYDIKSNMIKLNRNIALQGEIIGPKINGNRMKLRLLDFKIFNIYDIDNRKYLNQHEIDEICKQFGLRLPQVPILYSGNVNDLEFDYNGDKILFGDLSNDIDNNLKFIKDLFLNMSCNVNYTGGLPAEGIVVKTNDDGPRISFKVISNKYLLQK